jgi:hypothetical protein
MSLTLGTITTKSKKVLQPTFVNSFTIDFDSSYPTGGEPLDLSGTDLANHEILAVVVEPSGAYYFGYDYTNDKVLVYEGTAGANQQVGDTTDLQTLTGVRVTVFSQ